MIFLEIICFEFPCVAAAQIPKPHTPSGKKSVPPKVQFQYLLCQFRPISTIWRVISIETQNCFCEEQALVALPGPPVFASASFKTIRMWFLQRVG